MCMKIRISIALVCTALTLSGLTFTRLHIRNPLSVAKAAANITANCDSTEKKAMAVYRYITGNFQYDQELCDAILADEITAHVSDPQQTLNAQKGICCDLAVLCAAMLESQQINVEIVKGYYNGVYHAWNSVYDEETGQWMQIDVTSDLWNGRFRTAWPELDAAQYTISDHVDYSGLTPLTFGAGEEKPWQ